MVEVRAQGAANAQVTDRVKDTIFSFLEDRGLEGAREHLVLHHYKKGDFVAISNFGIPDIERFNKLKWEMGKAYHRNKVVNDDCVWIHREYIEKELLDEKD